MGAEQSVIAERRGTSFSYKDVLRNRENAKTEKFFNLTDRYCHELNEWKRTLSEEQKILLDQNDPFIENAAALSAMTQIAEDEGVSLDRTNRATDTWIKDRFGLDSKMSEAFQKLAQNPDEKVQEIDPRERWRLCMLDPVIVEMFEASPKADKLRHLMPLLFDNINPEGGDSYFYGVACGWEKGMRYLKQYPGKPITTEFLDALNFVCYSRGKSNDGTPLADEVVTEYSLRDSAVMESYQQHNYGMLRGITLTEAGEKEFHEFNASLRGIGGNKQGLLSYDYVMEEEPEHLVRVRREPCDPEIMKGVIQGILDDHYHSKTPQKESKFEVAQKVLRLHRYWDANSTTANVLLNMMSRQEDGDLLIYKNPNILSGHSVQEIADPDKLLDLSRFKRKDLYKSKDPRLSNSFECDPSSHGTSKEKNDGSRSPAGRG